MCRFGAGGGPHFGLHSRDPERGCRRRDGTRWRARERAAPVLGAGCMENIDAPAASTAGNRWLPARLRPL